MHHPRACWIGIRNSLILISSALLVMTDTPSISIITPSFQQGDFIAETLSSVLSQDYPNFEYLVIDGGSTDQTIKILESYQNDPRLTWISEPDSGQVEAILKGIERSKGEIIAWLNSDDIYLHPNVLAEVAQLFHDHPTTSLVSGSGIIINAKSEPVKEIDFETQRLSAEHIKRRNFILQPATFARRQVFDKVPLNRTLSYVFDWDFWIQCSQTFTIVPIEKRWAGYRFWGLNKTAQGSYRRTREQAQLVRKYLGRFSWQYFTLRAASGLYWIIEALPGRLQPLLRKTLRKFALALSKLTGYRIAVF